MPIKTGVGGALLPSELPGHISYNADLGVSESFVANIGNMNYFSAMEQISKLKPQSLDKNSYNVKDGFISAILGIWTTISLFFRLFKDAHTKSSNQFTTCVVPLPYFNTYYRTTVRDAFLDQSSTTNTKKSDSARSTYRRESAFLRLALNQHSEPNIWKQGDDVMVLLLQFKWTAFIQYRFYGIFAIHIVYYITYCIGVQFALENFNYDSTSIERSIGANSNHLACVILFFIAGTILLSLEINQVPKSSKFLNYFKYWYNYIDLAAIAFPLINFLQLTLDLDYFVSDGLKY